MGQEMAHHILVTFWIPEGLVTCGQLIVHISKVMIKGHGAAGGSSASAIVLFYFCLCSKLYCNVRKAGLDLTCWTFPII